MLLQTFSAAPAPVATTFNRGRLQRELVAQPDRIPPDRRVDLPEIRESYRVSFSDAVRAELPGQVRHFSPGGSGGPLENRLKLYRETTTL